MEVFPNLSDHGKLVIMSPASHYITSLYSVTLTSLAMANKVLIPEADPVTSYSYFGPACSHAHGVVSLGLLQCVGEDLQADHWTKGNRQNR